MFLFSDDLTEKNKKKSERLNKIRDHYQVNTRFDCSPFARSQITQFDSLCWRFFFRWFVHSLVSNRQKTISIESERGKEKKLQEATKQR